MADDINLAKRPLNHYLEEVLERRDLSPRRELAYRRVYERFDKHILSSRGVTAQEVDTTHAREFLNILENEFSLSPGSAQSEASALNQMFKDLNRSGMIDKNPVARAIKERDYNLQASPKRDVSVNEMGAFLKEYCKHPIFLAVYTTFAKTGIRVGELVNLDIRDVNLEHPIARAYSNLRPELEDRPDTLYVTSDIREGDWYRGEKRYSGNKRKRSTFIPIDSELKQILLNYLIIRPSIEVVEKPFFVGLGGTSKRRNQRFTPATVQDQLKKRAKERGWHSGSNNPMNVTPHYFRHFFTTHARERMDPMTVKYLRGDSGDDEMDRYTHNWGNRVRKTYLHNIYSLF